MTPKEKAKELVNKYWNEITYRDEEYEPNGDAIDSALLCVDEILEAYNPLEYYPEDLREYWDKVKEEIRKI